MTIRVTTVDTETGEEQTMDVPEHDYLIVCAGDCYMSNTRAYGKDPKRATHTVVIKRGPRSNPHD